MLPSESAVWPVPQQNHALSRTSHRMWPVGSAMMCPLLQGAGTSRVRVSDKAVGVPRLAGSKSPVRAQRCKVPEQVVCRAWNPGKHDLELVSVQDLASSKGLFARNADGGAAAYFQAAKDPVTRQLASRGVVVGTPEEGVGLVRAGAVNAYITEIGILKYYASLARPPRMLVTIELTLNPKPETLDPNLPSFTYLGLYAPRRKCCASLARPSRKMPSDD